MILLSYDLKKFFDFEELPDVMESLYKNEVRGKLYRLLAKMNTNVTIKVKTPVGMSEKEEVGQIVTQGGVEAALVSSNNVDVGVKESFTDKDKELKYETIQLGPLSYVDDITRLSDNPKDAEHGNKMIEEFIGGKNLALNLDKSNFIIIGNRKQRNKMKKELDKSPLNLCGAKMTEVVETKYLGEIIAQNNDESIHKTIMKRIAVSKLAVVEIRSIVEDARASRLGGINVAFDLFDSCILSSLLHNSETWDNIPKKSMKILDDFFTYFLRKIL